MSTTSVEIVRESTNTFNSRDYERLFSEFYGQHLEVEWHPDWRAFASSLEAIREPNLSEESKIQKIEESIVSVEGKPAFENMDAIREHVKKQFSSEEDLRADILELEGVGPYAILHQSKDRFGETVEGYILYHIVDGRILKMWMAKKD